MHKMTLKVKDFSRDQCILIVILIVQLGKQSFLLVLSNLKKPSEMRAQRLGRGKWAVLGIVFYQELSRQKWLIQRISCRVCTEFGPNSTCCDLAGNPVATVAKKQMPRC